jgi:SNF2 family DNA or RNA helicase
MIFSPLPHQSRAIDFIKRNKRCALHIDMGLGKTATTIAAMSELLDTFDIKGVMVFAPLRVATIAWPEEKLKWDQFAKLKFTVVRGSELERVGLLRKPADFYLLNYDLMTWWISFVAAEIKQRPIYQDAMILDESSRLKSASSSRFKTVRPLMDSKLFSRVVELTGTPAPEDYEDLFSQYRLLDGGKRLEKYVTHFRSKYYFQNPWCRFDLKLRPGADKDIQKRISDITFTVRAEEYGKLPQLIENTIHVELPSNARKVYHDFEKKMVAEIESQEVAAPSAAQVAEKCRQVVSGGVYDEEGKVIDLHKVKFDALDELIESSPGNLLVCYWYRHEFDTIRSRYKAPVLGPKASEKEALRTVREWNEGKHKLLFMHPASVGHGLNLQAGGNNLVWLTVPWSNEIYRQAVARLHRMGQSKPVVVHRIIALNTIDELVDKAVANKEFTQQELRKALASLTKQSSIHNEDL